MGVMFLQYNTKMLEISVRFGSGSSTGAILVAQAAGVPLLEVHC